MIIVFLKRCSSTTVLHFWSGFFFSFISQYLAQWIHVVFFTASAEFFISLIFHTIFFSFGKITLTDETIIFLRCSLVHTGDLSQHDNTFYINIKYIGSCRFYCVRDKGRSGNPVLSMIRVTLFFNGAVCVGGFRLSH